MNFSELKTVGVRGIGKAFTAPFRAFWKSHSRAVQFPFALIGSGILGTHINSLLILHTHKRPSAIGGMTLGMVVFVALFIGTYRRKVWSEWLICCRRIYSALAILGLLALLQILEGFNFFTTVSLILAIFATCRLNVEKHSPEWLQLLLKICVLMALSLFIYCWWTIVSDFAFRVTGGYWGRSERGLWAAFLLQLLSIPCFYTIRLGEEAAKIWKHNWKLALVTFVMETSFVSAFVISFYTFCLYDPLHQGQLPLQGDCYTYISWVIGLWVLQRSRARFADVTESTLIWPLVWGFTGVIGLVLGGMTLLLR